MIERWVFCDDELHRPDTCRGDDLFQALIAESEIGILVHRDGTVANRFIDGVVGVPQQWKESADAEETLYRLGHVAYADRWGDVEVTQDGRFICFAG